MAEALKVLQVSEFLRQEVQGTFMRLSISAIVVLFILVFATGANAQPSRQQFTVPTPSGGVLVESFGNCANATCPAVLILSVAGALEHPFMTRSGRRSRQRV
jgi:hypothetical protein